MNKPHKRHSPPGQEPPYAAFLVRCWREGEQWRFVLENVTTRERKGFDSLEALSLNIEDILNIGDDRPPSI